MPFPQNFATEGQVVYFYIVSLDNTHKMCVLVLELGFPNRLDLVAHW
jgi:hypothetical protein